MELYEVLGVVAIVISLLFVAYQIFQANRIARAEAETGLRSIQISFNQSVVENEELIAFVQKLTSTDAELTSAEQLRAFYYASNVRLTWDLAQKNFDNGVLSKESFLYYVKNVDVVFTALPGLIPYIARGAASRKGLELKGIFKHCNERLAEQGYEI